MPAMPASHDFHAGNITDITNFIDWFPTKGDRTGKSRQTLVFRNHWIMAVENAMKDDESAEFNCETIFGHISIYSMQRRNSPFFVHHAIAVDRSVNLSPFQGWRQ